MTDCEIILAILKDRKWHHVLEIMQRGKPGSVNWAVRSRIPDLKKKGFYIESRRAADGQSEYRLDAIGTVVFDKSGQGQLL